MWSFLGAHGGGDRDVLVNSIRGSYSCEGTGACGVKSRTNLSFYSNQTSIEDWLMIIHIIAFHHDHDWFLLPLSMFVFELLRLLFMAGLCDSGEKLVIRLVFCPEESMKRRLHGSGLGQDCIVNL